MYRGHELPIGIANADGGHSCRGLRHYHCDAACCWVGVHCKATAYCGLLGHLAYMGGYHPYFIVTSVGYKYIAIGSYSDTPGPLTIASNGSPQSPESPAPPVPAMVLMIPSASILRILL